MKRQTTARFLLAVALLVLAGGCASTPRSSSATVHHLVLCWLKEPGDGQASARLTQATHGLTDIPGVRSVSVGRAVASDRPVVDSSYDVAILIVLENEAALQGFLEHPKHRAARRDTLQPLAQKVVVYDFVVDHGS